MASEEGQAERIVGGAADGICLQHVGAYAPIMMNSPWAMLMTPISPNENARPSATSSRIEPTLSPLNDLREIDRHVPPVCALTPGPVRSERRAATATRPARGVE